MGADLYIRRLFNKSMKLHRPAFEAAALTRDNYLELHPEIRIVRSKGKVTAETKTLDKLQQEVTKQYDLMYSSGYFRDSYNANGVAQSLGFSWWKDVTPLLNRDSNLGGKNLLKFYEMIVSRKPRHLTADEIKGYGGMVDDGENSVEEWNKWHEKKHKQLIDFVKQAIKMKTSIHCSL